MRTLIFISLFFILHNCEILDAKGLETLKNDLKTFNKILKDIWNLIHPTTASKGICQTSACKRAASNLLYNMDPQVSPCDDFYKFACGNLLKSAVVPNQLNSISAFSSAYVKLQQQLRMSFEEKIEPKELKAFRLAKNLYKACMNKSVIEKRGLQPAQQILKTLGGWPVLEEDLWIDRGFEWKESVYKLEKMGYSSNYFFDFEVGTDEKDNTKRVLIIDEADLGLPREYLINGFSEKMVKSYYNYMVDLAVIFGADMTRAKKELKDSLEFEIRLANISLSNVQRRKVKSLYNPMTVKELSEKYPSIPWKEYFNTILEPIVKIWDDEVVIVRVPRFFEEFEKVMQQTPKRTQANYVMWRVAASSVSYLTENIQNRELKFSNAISGTISRESRWRQCLSMTSKHMRVSVGALYVRKYLHHDCKKHAFEIVNNIRREFQKMLKNVDWMDEKTKMNALQKAAAMRSNIAYPEELFDDKKLEEFYRNLETSPDDFLHSVLNATRTEREYSFSQLRKPGNRSNWVSHSHTTRVNAFYNPSENSYELPAGILHGSFFDTERPKYMNYGGIGFLTGHEITHGFDDVGREFDKDGNLEDWWNPETKKKYLEKAECIIHQYGNYTAEEVGIRLNGLRTQGENIADNGGIKEAYFAYQDWVKRHHPEPRLPGLNYSPSQLFWISAANVWCRKVRPAFLKRQILTGTHSPAHYRVLGSFSNRPEFAKDFNCPPGSRMNPVKKCSIW